MYISLVQRRMFQWCSRAFIWIVQVDVQEFVDSNQVVRRVFKGLPKVKVGSYQSPETGSCHNPVLSEYR